MKPIDILRPTIPPTFDEAFDNGASLEGGFAGRTPINQDFPVEGHERREKRWRDGTDRHYRDDDC